MERNVSSQKWWVRALDTSTNEWKTGDAANITARITKDFGTAAATNDTNPTEVDSTNQKGVYAFDLTQSETNAANVMVAAQSSTSGVLVFNWFPEEPKPQYHSQMAVSSGGVVSADAVAISGDMTAADNLEAAADGTGYNLGNGSIVAASVSGAVGSVTGNVGGNVVGSVASVTGNVGGNVTGSVGSISGVTFPANFSDLAITATTGRIDVGLVAGSSVSGVDDFKADVSGLATSSNQTTIVGHLTDIKGGTFNGTTDSLEAIRDRGDSAWITATGFSTLDASGVRTAIGLASANLDTQLGDIPTLTELQSEFTTIKGAAWSSSTDTLEAIRDRGDAAWVTATGFSTHSAADVWTATTRTLSAFAFSVTVGTNNDKTGYSLSTAPPTAADVADAVWDEDQSGHTTAGTFGKAAADTLADTNELQGNQGNWATATSVTVSDKTGFKLASDGLDSISTTPASGVPSNFREFFIWLYRRFAKKVTLTSTTMTHYADDGTTALTTQNVSDDGTTQTQGEAS